MIREVIVVIILGGLFGVPPLFAQTIDDWTGLWRVRVGKDAEPKFHWAISSEQGKLLVTQYDAAWKSQPLRVEKVDGDELDVTFQQGGRRTTVSVTRKGEQLSGTLKWRHVQFSVDEPVTGEKVVAANHWEPLEAVRRIENPEGVANVAAELIKAADGKSFKEFETAWGAEIGGPYYRFLQEYWILDPARRSEKLERLYRVLKSNQFKTNLKDFVAARNEVVRRIRDERPAFYLANPTIVLPSLEPASVSVIDAGAGKVYIRADVPEKLGSLSNPRLKWMIGKEQMKLALLGKFPFQVRAVSVELVREGVSGYLAADLLKVPLSDVLGTKPAKTEESVAKLESYRQGLAKLHRVEPELVSKTFAGDALNARQIVDLVGYKFGEQVASRFKPDEIAGLDRGRLLELVNSFLGIDLPRRQSPPADKSAGAEKKVPGPR